MKRVFDYDKTYCSCSNECTNKECERNIRNYETNVYATKIVWYSDLKDTSYCLKTNTTEE